MTSPVTVFDCIGSAVGSFTLPTATQVAGYVTGSGDVPWTPAQFSRFPGAIRIDQSPVNAATNETADVLDIERGAATVENLPEWVHAAWHSYQAGLRPGQRTPTVYQSLSNVTATVNALLAAGITNGVNLWVAGSMQQLQAADMLAAASGPFPIVAVQYAFQSLFDVSLCSAAWLSNVSKTPGKPQPVPGTQSGWAFCAKCQGLFYGPGEGTSHCPAGGYHDGSKSHSYTLPYVW
jgi:hypothetical protein